MRKMKANNAKQFFRANVMFNLYVLSLGFLAYSWEFKLQINKMGRGLF